MTTTLIVPGWRGAEAGHWQRILLERDPDAFLVEQEDWNRPVLTDWLHALEACLMARPGSVLVAHSLGAILVAHLARSPAAAHVAGALLVAPADARRMAKADPLFSTFAEMPQRRLPFASVVVASRNDPFMSFATAAAYARLWGSGVIDLGNAGHINPASGYGEWPAARVLAQSLGERDRSHISTSLRGFAVGTANVGQALPI